MTFTTSSLTLSLRSRCVCKYHSKILFSFSYGDKHVRIDGAIEDDGEDMWWQRERIRLNASEMP